MHGPLKGYWHPLKNHFCLPQFLSTTHVSPSHLSLFMITSPLTGCQYDFLEMLTNSVSARPSRQNGQKYPVTLFSSPLIFLNSWISCLLLHFVLSESLTVSRFSSVLRVVSPGRGLWAPGPPPRHSDGISCSSSARTRHLLTTMIKSEFVPWNISGILCLLYSCDFNVCCWIRP